MNFTIILKKIANLSAWHLQSLYKINLVVENVFIFFLRLLVFLLGVSGSEAESGLGKVLLLPLTLFITSMLNRLL